MYMRPAQRAAQDMMGPEVIAHRHPRRSRDRASSAPRAGAGRRRGVMAGPGRPSSHRARAAAPREEVTEGILDAALRQNAESGPQLSAAPPLWGQRPPGQRLHRGSASTLGSAHPAPPGPRGAPTVGQAPSPALAQRRAHTFSDSALTRRIQRADRRTLNAERRLRYRNPLTQCGVGAVSRPHESHPSYLPPCSAGVWRARHSRRGVPRYQRAGRRT
jgi:hypothetical protein